MIQKEKIEIVEPVSGFTEREKNSKAILNTDRDSLLKYKIQRKKFLDLNKNSSELGDMKNQINNLKNDLSEIKELLLQITKR